MAEDRGVLAVERSLRRQCIDAFEQLRASERRFGAGVFSPGLIDRLGHRRFVFIELLEGPLEIGVGIGGAGQGASGRGESKISSPK